MIIAVLWWVRCGTTGLFICFWTYWIFFDRKKIVSAMKLTQALRLINNQTLDALKSRVQLTVAQAPQFLKQMKEDNQKIVHGKLVKLNNWYTRLIRLDKVAKCQEKVVLLQDRLLETQEKRREVGKQLADIREKSLALQDEINKVKKREDLKTYLDLMKQEAELLQLEDGISRTFHDYDQTERELFTAFTNAIQDSHQTQRAQLEYTKYLGLILSITGTLLAFIHSSLKKHELKKFIGEKLMDQRLSEPVVLNLIKANERTEKETVKTREMLNKIVEDLQVRNRAPLYVPEQYMQPQNVDLGVLGAGAICIVLICICVASCR